MASKFPEILHLYGAHINEDGQTERPADTNSGVQHAKNALQGECRGLLTAVFTHLFTVKVALTHGECRIWHSVVAVKTAFKLG